MNEIQKYLADAFVKENLLLEGKFKMAARKFLEENNFQEYHTPILMPEHGEKYNPLFHINIEGTSACLADSPQIFKMFLSLSAVERYYQIAPCFRPIEEEDAIHTRLCEFTQIDLEMQVEKLSQLTEMARKLLLFVLGDSGMEPVITHMEGSDCLRLFGPQMKPDLRRQKGELSIVFIEHMPLISGEKTKEGRLKPCHHIFALPSDEIDDSREEGLLQATTESFDMVVNGIEIGGGDLRIADRGLQIKLMDLFGVERERYTDYLEMMGESRKSSRGGFAMGLERLIMAVTGCKDIRQTVCFPDFYKRSGF